MNWTATAAAVTTLPVRWGRTALGLTGLPGSALTNARAGTRDLALAVAHRLALQPLDDDCVPSAGDLGVLSRAECLLLLRGQRLGRLAYIARAGVPDIVPVNFTLYGDTVLIASGPGPKLQAAERRELVAFEVDHLDEAGPTGWSVVVSGRARRLSTTELQAQRRSGDALPLPWANGPRHSLIQIVPTRIAGRRLH